MRAEASGDMLRLLITSTFLGGLVGPNYLDLDESVRAFMLEELDQDIEDGGPYIGRYLSDAGILAYPALLRESLASHDPGWLQNRLASDGLMKVVTAGSTGKPRKVPGNAAQTLSESEFGRYFGRGVCRRALEADEKAEVEVYRARNSNSPRPESEALIGLRFRASEVLELIRSSRIDPNVAVPQVNSGLSLRLVRAEDFVQAKD